MTRLQIASQLEKIAKELMAVPMSYDMPTTETTRWAKKSLGQTLGIDSSWKQIYELFLTFMEGTSNKFHYFGVFKSRMGDCVGGNAYGRIGYAPKAIEVSRGNEYRVMGDVQKKVYEKKRKGYSETRVF